VTSSAAPWYEKARAAESYISYGGRSPRAHLASSRFMHTVVKPIASISWFVLIHLSDPEYQVKLLVFLWNSGVHGVERIDDDALRIEDEQTSDEQLRAILDLWRRTHPLVYLEIT